MKRSFHCNDVLVDQMQHKKRSKVAVNSLESLDSFNWQIPNYTYDVNSLELSMFCDTEGSEENYLADTDTSADQTESNYSDSSTEGINALSDDDDLLFNFLTQEDWLLEKESLPLESNVNGTTEQHNKHDCDDGHYVDATTIMSQECIDYFMAEYLRAMGGSSKSQMSFADFVTDSLDRIATYSRASPQTPARSTSSRGCKEVYQHKLKPSSNDKDNFDFSINKWILQRRNLSNQMEHDVRSSDYSFCPCCECSASAFFLDTDFGNYQSF